MPKKRAYEIKHLDRLVYIFDGKTREMVEIDPDTNKIEALEDQYYYLVFTIRNLPSEFIRANLIPIYFEEINLSSNEYQGDRRNVYMAMSDIPHWLVAKLFEMGYDPYILASLRREPVF